MTSRFGQLALLALLVACASGVAVAQVSTTGKLVGTVTDITGAVVAGAEVTVVDEATRTEIVTQSGADGTFAVSNLRPGTYNVRVTLAGFKAAEYRAVKIIVGATYNLRATLQVGEVQSTVVVEAGAEVLETASTTVANTITGKAINTLPLVSRDALDLAVMMPGAQTGGRPRNSSFMGLPKGAMNITLDGINAQDNVLKSSDGFFTIMRPRIDSIEEFSISVAAQGAEQAAEGAVQIRMLTKRGSNDYHGGVWWYHRNDFLNSNFYFSNLAGLDRQRLRLNQFGYQVGGPIIKEKLFFFHAFDFYRKPDSLLQTRTILTDEAAQGLFRYAVGAVPATPPAWVTCNAPAGSAGQCVANLFQMAGNFGFSSTADPFASGAYTAIAGAVNVAGVSENPQPSLFQRSISFNDAGFGRRFFPDFRFDWEVTKSHSLTAIYHYNYFDSKKDFLNGRGITYPVAPFDQNFGSQISNRNQPTAAWRWNLAANMSNEVRFGIQSAPVSFFPDINRTIYPSITTNLGTVVVRPLFDLVSQPFLSGSISGRNSALGQLIETFSWTKGKHNLNFGGNYTRLRFVGHSEPELGSVGFGLVTDDPAQGIFSGGNLPGSNSTDRTNAAALYGNLAGRIDDYGIDVFVNEETRQFENNRRFIDRADQHEWGLYVSDNWRLFSSLTLNWGLRYEYQGNVRSPEDIFYRQQNGFDDLFGVSGTGNLFMPGTLTGPAAPIIYELNGDREWYKSDKNNFLPNIGLAWTPSYDAPWYRWIFGGAGKTVFRGGYSITVTREGLNNFFTIAEGNPGFFGSQFAVPVEPGTATIPGTFDAGSATLGTGLTNVDQDPASFGNSFALDPLTGFGVNAFDPDLATPYVQSWRISIQREITPDLVFEVGYVGNHSVGLLRQLNLNEINIFENGFLTEFLVAQNNLAICRSVAMQCLMAAGQSNTNPVTNTNRFFSNLGLSGQLPVPIMTAAFTGSQTGSQTNANFRSGFRISNLDNGVPGSFANILATNFTFWNNIQAAGLPSNFWRVNPHARGGSFLMYNGAQSTYNALVLELRRRMTKGLYVNGNYVWSKSLTNYFANSSISFDQVDTLRNIGRDKGVAPFDFRHAFKLQLIYELPFGPGRKWSSDRAWLNRIIEGWEFSSNTRWQSGRVTQITGGLGGTFNQNDGGVQLIGTTPNQVQDMLDIRQLPDGRVFWFPDSLLDANQQLANSSVLASCNTPGQFCNRFFITGPRFFRADWTVIKRTRIREGMNVEFRAEFLNAFNNINFLYAGNAAATPVSNSLQSATFGRMTTAYQDISTTDDPGGRIIQIVMRVNF